MTTTIYTDKTTVIEADWCNDVDAVVYQAVGDGSNNPPTTPAEVRTNIDVNSATDLASTANAKGASLVGVEDSAANFTGTTVEAVLAEIISNLASTANGKGASTIGVEDSATNFTATTVEAVLAEIISTLASTSTGAGASTVGVEDSAANFTGTTVEAVLAEIMSNLASTANAKGASLVGVEDASGYFTATDVEAALTELHEGDTLTSETATATTSGTSHDYTSIPSWVKKITVSLSGVSTSGTSPVILQIGDSGGIEATSYLGTGGYYTAAAQDADLYTTGFGFKQDPISASNIFHGVGILTLLDSSTNTWSWQFTGGASNTAVVFHGAGSKALSATLDRVRLTTVGGTDTFDAGSFNIIYE